LLLECRPYNIKICFVYYTYLRFDFVKTRNRSICVII